MPEENIIILGAFLGKGNVKEKAAVLFDLADFEHNERISVERFGTLWYDVFRVLVELI